MKLNRYIQFIPLLAAAGMFCALDGGHPPDMDLKTAQEKAAGGDAEGQFFLGRAYFRGAGVPQDDTQAAAFYRKSAEQGFYKAQTNLGSLYLQGRGVKKDEAEAAKWYRKAADQGAALAEDSLGSLYIQGCGVPKDANEGLKWYRKAADQSLLSAQLHLANLYYFGGPGVAQDYKEAAKWVKITAEQGNRWAQNVWGAMHEEGLGMEKDHGQAVIWYRKAAIQGEAKAQASLGMRYVYGAPGLKVDSAKAFFWLTLGTRQGEPTAHNALTDFKHGFKPEEIAEGNRLVQEYLKKKVFPEP